MLLALPVLHAARAGELAAEKPLPPTTEAALIMKDIVPEAPVYLRVFKEESELEVWKARPNGRYALIKTFPVCNWGGTLGPKRTRGDSMSPEGFYHVTLGALKPDSKYHLAFNIGYPNALDRALGRTGAYIMVHGDCRSVGCFAMSDKFIEEIYAFVRDALAAGESSVPVHVFPFRMTAANMKRHADNPARGTWGPLKQAYDDFSEDARAAEDRHVQQALCRQLAVAGRNGPLRAMPVADWQASRAALATARQNLVKADPDLEAKGKKMKSELAANAGSDFLVNFSWGTTTASVSTRKSSPPRMSSDAALGAVQPLLSR